MSRPRRARKQVNYVVDMEDSEDEGYGSENDEALQKALRASRKEAKKQKRILISDDESSSGREEDQSEDYSDGDESEQEASEDEEESDESDEPAKKKVTRRRKVAGHKVARKPAPKRKKKPQVAALARAFQIQRETQPEKTAADSEESSAAESEQESDESASGDDQYRWKSRPRANPAPARKSTRSRGPAASYEELDESDFNSERSESESDAHTGSSDDSSSGEESDFGDREVETIKKKRSKGGEVQYLVKWQGQSRQHNSWVKARDLDCPGLIKRFEKQLGKQARAEDALAVLEAERGEHVVEKLLGVRKAADGDDEKEFLVKWKGRGYIHASWTLRSIIDAIPQGSGYVSRFLGKARREGHSSDDEEDDDGGFFDPNFTMIDRLVTHAELEKGGLEYLVKWRGLQYSASTWETEADLALHCPSQCAAEIARYNQYNKAARANSGGRVGGKYHERDRNEDFQLTFTEGLQLRSYQQEGVSWMAFNWRKRRNSILADEMGLGKTVQSTALCQYLLEKQGIAGPFLIVGPLSTIPHWKREFEAWTQMNVVNYHGDAVSRAMIRKYEFHADGQSGRRGEYRFNALVTTYETILQDIEHLNKVQWKLLVVDEAHRLKNPESRLCLALETFRFESTLLLTGTPIQNNIKELWALLHFLDPKSFADFEDFERRFGAEVLKDNTSIEALHRKLKPYLLRRMKGDVEAALPPRKETIIDVALTAFQKKVYRAVFEKNTNMLLQVGGAEKDKSVTNLNNIAMQLRKICNHPYLLEGVEDAQHLEAGCEDKKDVMQLLIRNSAKFILLDKLLPKLKRDGHRVLVFSQMSRVLDVLEDYLNFRDMSYERVDGSVTGMDRQAAIDRYSQKGSDIFAFLLTTRAGGVGINLTAADTVIIFDSDWNPQNDIQAQARCHRIGQTQSVQVYRLLTKNTYEMEMFRRSSLKLGLDQAVLHDIGGASSSKARKKSSKSEIEDLLKKGAYHVFLDNAEETTVDAEGIDDILQRAEVVEYDEGGLTKKSQGNSFAKASFVSEGDDGHEMDINDPDFWKKVGLKEAKQEQVLKPRSRKQAQTWSVGSDGAYGLAKPTADLDFMLSDEDDEEDDKPGRPDLDALPAGCSSLYTGAERDALVAAISQVGYGRWGLVRERVLAALAPTPAPDAAAVAVADASNGTSEKASDIPSQDEVKWTDEALARLSLGVVSRCVVALLAKEKRDAAKRQAKRAQAAKDAADAGKAPSKKRPPKFNPARTGAAIVCNALFLKDLRGLATPASMEDDGVVSSADGAGACSSSKGDQPKQLTIEEQWNEAVGMLERFAEGAAGVDPILLTVKFDKFLRGTSPTTCLCALDRVAVLHETLQSQTVNLVGLLKGVKTQVPAKWWTTEHDASLLRGVYEQGLQSFEEVRQGYGFPEVVGSATAPVAGADGQDKPASSAEVPPSEEPTAKSQAKEEANADAKDGAVSSTREWPHEMLLNRRVRGLCSHIQKEQRKAREKAEKLKAKELKAAMKRAAAQEELSAHERAQRAAAAEALQKLVGEWRALRETINNLQESQENQGGHVESYLEVQRGFAALTKRVKGHVNPGASKASKAKKRKSDKRQASGHYGKDAGFLTDPSSLKELLRVCQEGETLSSVQLSRARMSSMMSSDSVFASPKKKKQKQETLAGNGEKRLALSPSKQSAAKLASGKGGSPKKQKAKLGKTGSKTNSGSKRKKAAKPKDSKQRKLDMSFFSRNPDLIGK